MAAPGNQPVGRPTLEAVAARAGVGRGTVSRVINGSAQVSARAREAVLGAIEDLGYVPNRAARSLVTRRTDGIALVVSESEDRVFAEPFFAGVVRGVSAEIAGTAFQLWLAMINSSTDRSRIGRHLTAQHVDGAMLLSLHGDDSLPRLLEESGLPTVLGGRPTGLVPGSYVDVDNHAGARMAIDHLIARGRRRIATIAGPQDMSAGVARLDGYRGALRDAGLLGDDDGLVAYGQFSESSGQAAMQSLLSRRPDLDAVFAASDPMAFGAMRAIKQAGGRIPEDIAVVGFDGSPAAGNTEPPLTTVHQPAEAMGRHMARLLLALIAGQPVDEPTVILVPDLVVRDSS
ncbi:MAG TPA: LacI family DNA-binding transcriptional regulator [Acidimicrobiales bacterium]|nr:LacI family DNA-binding transcriptional regulator [Acidimicrobiales bacterium]